MLRIAIQSKGRLHEDTMALLAETGIKVAQGKRSLLEQGRGFPIEVLYLRDDDIPQCVAAGVADIGVVGKNEYAERGEDVKILRGLGFSRCRLSLAVPKEAHCTGLDWFEGKKIATSYPEILKRFLAEKNIRADVHVIAGSVEICPSIGLSDAIFDIVSSGGTLASNNLVEAAVVMESEAVLIAANTISKEKQTVLDELLFRIDAALAANGKKYVLMNVPNDSLDSVIAVLPGTKSPTVMPLATKGWSSVHTVVGEQRLWEIIGKLKELGAQGILVVPIEKMIL
ncbi:MAG: ATP phosphoribosyltransferase [Prevotella sp.]|nr:ATP phosphoribosyltransferase [Prevotella sp.]